METVINRAADTDQPAAGFVQVYTGDGKGKTTAALGLAMRCVGSGGNVYIGQFIKQHEYCEVLTVRQRFPEITLEQYGRGCFITNAPSAEDIELAHNGLDKLRQALLSENYRLVIADEINVAAELGLLQTADLLELCRCRPAGVELVMTGRNAPPELINSADLVSEIREIKHYYSAGVTARKGIEC